MSEPLLKLPCLSVQEPWATALVTPDIGKDVENRRWQNSPGLLAQARRLVGQCVAIHASKTYDASGYHHIRQLTGKRVPKETCSLGHVIGVITLADVRDWSSSRWYADGQVALVRRDPIVLDRPIEQRGALGFFFLDEQKTDMIRRQLAFHGVTL